MPRHVACVGALSVFILATTAAAQIAPRRFEWLFAETPDGTTSFGTKTHDQQLILWIEGQRPAPVIGTGVRRDWLAAASPSSLHAVVQLTSGEFLLVDFSTSGSRTRTRELPSAQPLSLMWSAEIGALLLLYADHIRVITDTATDALTHPIDIQVALTDAIRQHPSQWPTLRSLPGAVAAITAFPAIDIAVAERTSSGLRWTAFDPSRHEDPNWVMSAASTAHLDGSLLVRSGRPGELLLIGERSGEAIPLGSVDASSAGEWLELPMPRWGRIPFERYEIRLAANATHGEATAEDRIRMTCDAGAPSTNRGGEIAVTPTWNLAHVGSDTFSIRASVDAVAPVRWVTVVALHGDATPPVVNTRAGLLLRGDAACVYRSRFGNRTIAAVPVPHHAHALGMVLYVQLHAISEDNGVWSTRILGLPLVEPHQAVLGLETRAPRFSAFMDECRVEQWSAWTRAAPATVIRTVVSLY